MRKLLLLLLLPCVLQMEAQKEICPMGSIKDVVSLRPHRAIHAADNQGVTATLKYEQIADMNVARISHQVLPSGNGFVVVGGRTTGFQLTRTAELYQNGGWQSLSIDNAHDGAFSVQLPDGRFMVGGGFSSANGVGQSKATDIYDPKTRTFTTGPQLTTARAQSKAITTGSKVYVSGNKSVDDSNMDCFNGTSFTAVGAMDGRSNPYMMVNRKGDVIVFSAYNTEEKSFGFYTFEDGTQCLLADRYDSTTGETKYYAVPFTPQSVPMALPDDERSEDYHFTLDGNGFYVILTKTTNGYLMYMIDMDNEQYYVFNSFVIPTADAATGATITWRGGVLVNESRNEVYLIGTSGPVNNQTLHVISYNYFSGEWTIASAAGFRHNLLTASWTLQGDGRLACTGGGVKDNTDAQRRAYLITPPTAGQGDSETPTPQPGDPKLVVWLKSGDKVVYDLIDVPVTTFSGSQLIIRTNKVTIPYERKDVLRYTYEDVVSDGIELSPSERRVEINRDGDEITFRGLQVGSSASIYAVNGTLIEQRKVTDSRPLSISLKNRPDGVYIVKAGTETIKVMKR